MEKCECSCDQIKQIVKEVVKDAFQQKMTEVKTEGKTRTKRKPSQYNIFMGNCIKKKEGNFKTCAAKYKEQKGKTPKKE